MKRLLIISIVLFLCVNVSAYTISLTSSDLIVTLPQVITVDLTATGPVSDLTSVSFVASGGFDILGLGSWIPGFNFAVNNGTLTGSDIIDASAGP